MNATSTNATASLDSRLRQIAILVASVDTVAARQVLMQLPTEIAKRVRALAANLGPVPPEERRALLAEFQKSQAHAKQPGQATNAQNAQLNAAHAHAAHTQAVSGQASPGSANLSQRTQQDLTARAFSDYPGPMATTYQPLHADIENPSWTRLSVETLVRLVKTERPTVIAVVLQQLPASQVAAVLQRLPRSITKDVLQTLGSMNEIDQEAMKAIDEHLSERLRDYHHKIESEIEQSRRMNELLAAAPPELKQQWASWLRPDVYLDENGVQSAAPVSATASALNTLDRLYQSATITTNDTAWMQNGGASSARQPSSIHQNGSAAQPSVAAPSVTNNSGVANNTQPIAANQNATKNPTTNTVAEHPTKSTSSKNEADDGPHTIPFPGVRKSDGPDMSTAERKLLQARMEKLLKLDTESLAQLLSSLDSQTVLLALAGASPQFMKRFSSMLEPEDAKVLDQRIKRIGSVNLRDIDAAQLRMVQSFDAKIAAKQPNKSAQQKRAA